VLGLIILAVVTGVIEAANSGATLALGAIGFIVGKAALFLFGATALGMAISPKLFGLAARVRGQGVLLATALVFCFGMSYLAAAIGLAAIVGAYAAGLILEEVHFRAFMERGDPGLREMLQPISTLLAPVFFVLMGMHVDLSFLGDADAIRLAALLTVAAIVGKQACSLGALGTKLDRLTIGLGMIPRGEVGLIFANLGMGLTVHGERVVDAVTYSAVVIMVLVTTMVTPPALRLSLRRAEARR
jgi:Kef-type K+ transport system membrane component KefB